MFLEETPIVSYRPAGPKGPLEFEDLWSGLVSKSGYLFQLN